MRCLAHLSSERIVSSGSSQVTGEECEVEAIRGRREHEGVLQYLVKWAGYPEVTNEWLSLVCCVDQSVPRPASW